MPTRSPMICESARWVSSRTRAAAASVSRITCGRGRGFGLAGAAGGAAEAFDVISVMCSIPWAVQGHQRMLGTKCLPHIEHEAGLVAHPVRRPGRLPDNVDLD